MNKLNQQIKLTPELKKLIKDYARKCFEEIERERELQAMIRSVLDMEIQKRKKQIATLANASQQELNKLNKLFYT